MENIDTYREKARAIVFNKENKIYVCNLKGNLILPGGSIEENELKEIAMKRELKEELGLISYDLKELITIEHFHENFPIYKSEVYENRLNKITYFLVEGNHEVDLSKVSYTDYEIDHNIKIEAYSIKELRYKLQISTGNKWKKFTNKELITVLDYIEK